MTVRAPPPPQRGPGAVVEAVPQFLGLGTAVGPWMRFDGICLVFKIKH